MKSLNALKKTEMLLFVATVLFSVILGIEKSFWFFFIPPFWVVLTWRVRRRVEFRRGYQRPVFVSVCIVITWIPILVFVILYSALVGPMETGSGEYYVFTKRTDMTQGIVRTCNNVIGTNFEEGPKADYHLWMGFSAPYPFREVVRFPKKANLICKYGSIVGDRAMVTVTHEDWEAQRIVDGDHDIDDYLHQELAPVIGTLIKVGYRESLSPRKAFQKAKEFWNSEEGVFCGTIVKID